MLFIKLIPVLSTRLYTGKAILSSLRHCTTIKRFTSTSSGDKFDVYTGPLARNIRGVKMFSLTTSVIGLTLQPVLYQQVTAAGGSTSVFVAVGAFFGFFTFVTPLLLHFITKKYVTRIEYYPKEDKYSLTTITLFLRERTEFFTPNDVEVPDVIGLFTSFHVKGRPVFVDPRLFPETSHYSKIMGYDKPIDFKLRQVASRDDRESQLK